MGIGGSACSESEDWQCDPALPGVQALSCLFFKGEACQWDVEAAKLISLAENHVPASQYSQALVDRDWWQQHVASTDEEAGRTVFDLMATDPAGRQINLYEVLSCAVTLSPHLRTDVKLAILWGLWDCHEEGGSHFGVDKATDLCCSLLLGLHRLSVLVPSPPERADVENDICRLIWVLRKQQPVRSDVFAFEEVLFISDLDAALRDFFAKFQGAAASQEVPEISGGDLPPESRIVDAAGRGLRRGGRGRGRGSAAVGRSGRGASRREHSAPRHSAANVGAVANVSASGVSATTASAVLSRRDVLEAFDLFKEIRAEQDRLPRRGGAQPRDTSAIRSVSKIKNAQVQLAVKRLLSRGQVLELRDFLRMLALSKAPAAFTEAHLRVFEVWIMDRVQLTDSELIKYRLDKVAEPTQSAGKPAAGEHMGQHAAGRRRLHTLVRRAQAPAVQAWLQRQRSALFGDRKARSPTGGQDLTITLEQAVTQGVMPPELATAAARTFGWEASHVLTEGCFLELFVPCAPNDYHSLDFMRGFRRAWLSVNEGMDEGVEDSRTDLSPEKGAAGDRSWLFEEGEGLQMEPSMDLQLPSRPSSAPPAPRCSLEERRIPDVSDNILLARPPAPLPPSHPSSEPDFGTRDIDGIPRMSQGSADSVLLANASAAAPSTPPRPTRPAPVGIAGAQAAAPAAPVEGNAPPHGNTTAQETKMRAASASGSGGASGSGANPGTLAVPRVVGIGGAGSAGMPQALGKEVGSLEVGEALAPLGRSPAAHSAGSYEEDTFEEFSEGSGPAASPKYGIGGGAAGASTSIPTSIPSLSAAALEDSGLEAPPADVSYEDIVRRSTRSTDSSRPSLGVPSVAPSVAALSVADPDSARLSIAEEHLGGSH